jgi:hypothetical protein
MTDETDRLRLENEHLRDEVEQTRQEHHKILDLLESRLSAPEQEEEHRSHKGRWLLFLMAVGGGIYAWTRMRQGNGQGEWAPMADSPTVRESGSATI